LLLRSQRRGTPKQRRVRHIGLEGLRPARRRRGVVVTTSFPGFVRTPLLGGLMAAGQTKVPPGAIDVDTSAAKILAAVRRGKRVASFPWSTSLLVSLARFLPPLFYDRIMTRRAAWINLTYGWAAVPGGLALRGGRRQQALGLHPAAAVLQHGP
jgi:hypothetical protein